MNTLIGLIIIAIGSFGQSSSYVPINKVKNWSWESFWLVAGDFCMAFISFVRGFGWLFLGEVALLSYAAQEELFLLLSTGCCGVLEDLRSDLVCVILV